MIPKGFLFEYVSQPNYFGEIVQWFGYGIMTMQFEQLLFGFTSLLYLSAKAK